MTDEKQICPICGDPMEQDAGDPEPWCMRCDQDERCHGCGYETCRHHPDQREELPEGTFYRFDSDGERLEGIDG